MRKPVVRYLTLQDQSELGITGIVHTTPFNQVRYGFRGAGDGRRIDVARHETARDVYSTSWVNLERSGYRLDSGRLIGATRLRDALLGLIDNQEVEGGPNWISERLVGRIRHLRLSFQIDVNEADTLDALEKALQPNAGKWVETGDRQRGWYSIDSMLDDIAALRAAGMDRLDLWWTQCGWIDGAALQEDVVVEHVLAEYYRRQQLVFAEVVTHTFPGLAGEMASYTCLPARWEITVVKGHPFGPTVHSNWSPVASWQDAGAEVTFSDNPPPWRYDDELRQALDKLKRPSDRYSTGGFSIMPSFEGRWWDGRFSGATAVAREVCSMLKKEIEYLFSALPSRDAIS